MYQDDDPIETSEWLDALESLIENEGVDRAKYILERLSERASRDGTELPYSITTPFRNSIPVTQESRMPGDLFMERRIRSLIRWNAMAMVVRANKRPGDLGGHISQLQLNGLVIADRFTHGLAPLRVAHRQLHRTARQAGAARGWWCWW